MIPGDPGALEASLGALDRSGVGFDDAAGAVRSRERTVRAVWTGQAANAASVVLDDLARATTVGAVVSDDVGPVLRRYATELRTAQQSYTAAHQQLLATAGGTLLTDAALAASPAAGAPQQMADAARALAMANTAAARDITAITSRLTGMQTDLVSAVPPPSPPPPPPPNDGAGPWGVRDPTGADYARVLTARVAADVFEGIGRVHAARHMRHYLDNIGTPLVVDPALMTRDDPIFRLAAERQAAESITTTAREALRSGRFGVPVPFDTGWENFQFRQDLQPDWFYAIGTMSYSTTGTVTVVPGPPGTEPRVEAEHQLHVFDRYNWDGTKATEIAGMTVTDAQLAEMHRAGLAREYDVHGGGPRESSGGTLPGPNVDSSLVPPRDETRGDPGRSRW